MGAGGDVEGLDGDGIAVGDGRGGIDDTGDVEIGNAAGIDAEGRAERTVKRKGIGGGGEKAELDGSAVGGALAVHAGDGVGNVPDRREGLPHGVQEPAENGRLGVFAMEAGLGVAGDGAVHVFDCGGEQGEGVAFDLGEVDDEVGVEDRAGEGEGEAAAFEGLAASLLKREKGDIFIGTDGGDSGGAPDVGEIGGTGGAVADGDVGAGGLEPADDVADEFRMGGDGLPGGTICEEIGLDEDALAVERRIIEPASEVEEAAEGFRERGAVVGATQVMDTVIHGSNIAKRET